MSEKLQATFDRTGRKLFVCPICQKAKTWLPQHIKSCHGEHREAKKVLDMYFTSSYVSKIAEDGRAKRCPICKEVRRNVQKHIARMHEIPAKTKEYRELKEKITETKDAKDIVKRKPDQLDQLFLDFKGNFLKSRENRLSLRLKEDPEQAVYHDHKYGKDAARWLLETKLDGELNVENLINATKHLGHPPNECFIDAMMDGEKQLAPSTVSKCLIGYKKFVRYIKGNIAPGMKFERISCQSVDRALELLTSFNSSLDDDKAFQTALVQEKRQSFCYSTEHSDKYLTSDLSVKAARDVENYPNGRLTKAGYENMLADFFVKVIDTNRCRPKEIRSITVDEANKPQAKRHKKLLYHILHPKLHKTGSKNKRSSVVLTPRLYKHFGVLFDYSQKVLSRKTSGSQSDRQTPGNAPKAILKWNGKAIDASSCSKLWIGQHHRACGDVPQYPKEINYAVMRADAVKNVMEFCNETEQRRIAHKMAHNQETRDSYYSYLAADFISVSATESMARARQSRYRKKRQ